MEAIVLAGGLGTRLASRLHGLPKPMAPVAGRPFLEILLTQLRRSGCTRVLLSVGHQHTVIQDHFGASFHGMAIDYVIESVPLGTGGAIRLALAEAREESVLVLNGDTFLDADYAAMLRFHAAAGAAVTLAVVHRDDVSRYGSVTIEGQRIAGFQEKGNSGPGYHQRRNLCPGTQPRVAACAARKILHRDRLFHARSRTSSSRRLQGRRLLSRHRNP